MEALTRRQLRFLYLAIELNLVLWLAVFNAVVWNSSAERAVKHIAGAGFIVAALLQHWGYYNLHKRARREVECRIRPVLWPYF